MNLANRPMISLQLPFLVKGEKLTIIKHTLYRKQTLIFYQAIQDNGYQLNALWHAFLFRLSTEVTDLTSCIAAGLGLNEK